MAKEFGKAGITEVSITNKGNVKFLIASDKTARRISVQFPDNLSGVAKQEGGKITVITMADEEEAQFITANFDHRNQTVNGTQTNIAVVNRPLFTGQIKNSVVVMGDDNVINSNFSGGPNPKGKVVIYLSDGLTVRIKSCGGEFTFAGFSGNVDLELTGGTVNAAECAGDVRLVLRQHIKVDYTKCNIGNLVIDADGSGRVKVLCTVKNLNVWTQGIDVVVDDVAEELEYEVKRALFMVLKKDLSVSK